MSEAPKIAVIGAKHGKWIAREIRRLETQGLCELVALCRGNSGQCFSDIYAAMFQAGLPPARVKEFYDHRQMFDRTMIDAAIIASPPEHHLEHAIDAMNAGCDVYIEKPLLWTTGIALSKIKDAGAELISEADATKRMIAGGSQLPAWFSTPSEGAYTVMNDIPPQDIYVAQVTLRTGSGILETEKTLIDLLPHAIGIWNAVLGPGTLALGINADPSGKSAIMRLPFKEEQEGSVIVNAQYIRAGLDPVPVRATLDTTPRPTGENAQLSIKINGETLTRTCTRQPYQITLHSDESSAVVNDPLTLSLARFISGKPLTHGKNLLHQHNLLCDTMEAFYRTNQQ